jgi:hypothetical protein
MVSLGPLAVRKEQASPGILVTLRTHAKRVWFGCAVGQSRIGVVVVASPCVLAFCRAQAVLCSAC